MKTQGMDGGPNFQRTQGAPVLKSGPSWNFFRIGVDCGSIPGKQRDSLTKRQAEPVREI
jgi:hypothetical protein